MACSQPFAGAVFKEYAKKCRDRSNREGHVGPGWVWVGFQWERRGQAGARHWLSLAPLPLVAEFGVLLPRQP
eukprot:1255600-Amphidinium_carterae.1